MEQVKSKHSQASALEAVAQGESRKDGCWSVCTCVLLGGGRARSPRPPGTDRPRALSVSAALQDPGP